MVIQSTLAQSLDLLDVKLVMRLHQVMFATSTNDHSSLLMTPVATEQHAD